MTTTVLVVTTPDDQALRVLDPPPADTVFTVGWDPVDFGATAADAEVLLLGGAGRDIVQPLLQRAPTVRWIHSLNAGLDNLMFPALVDGPIVVTNARGVFSRTLGEWTMAAVLFFAKDLRHLVRAQAARQWDPREVEEVAGRTLAVVGYGDIGRAVAARAASFEMHVIGVRRDPAVTDGVCAEIVGVARLHEVLARSDYVVVATPLTPGTRGLVGAAALGAMKPSAVLINIGRGAVVDEPALIDALRHGQIRGAALDVYEREPLPADSPLYTLENVLLSPHCADHVTGWREASVRLFLENLARFRSGARLRNVVDKHRGY